MLKPSVAFHEFIQHILPGVSKRRMPHVVRKSQRLGKIGVQRESAGNSTGNLSDLNAVREAGTVMIPFMINEDLGFVLQTPKGA